MQEPYMSIPFQPIYTHAYVKFSCLFCLGQDKFVTWSQLEARSGTEHVGCTSGQLALFVRLHETNLRWLFRPPIASELGRLTAVVCQLSPVAILGLINWQWIDQRCLARSRIQDDWCLSYSDLQFDRVCTEVNTFYYSRNRIRHIFWVPLLNLNAQWIDVLAGRRLTTVSLTQTATTFHQHIQIKFRGYLGVKFFQSFRKILQYSDKPTKISIFKTTKVLQILYFF